MIDGLTGDRLGRTPSLLASMFRTPALLPDYHG